MVFCLWVLLLLLIPTDGSTDPMTITSNAASPSESLKASHQAPDATASPTTRAPRTAAPTAATAAPTPAPPEGAGSTVVDGVLGLSTPAFNNNKREQFARDILNNLQTSSALLTNPPSILDVQSISTSSSILKLNFASALQAKLFFEQANFRSSLGKLKKLGFLSAQWTLADRQVLQDQGETVPIAVVVIAGVATFLLSTGLTFQIVKAKLVKRQSAVTFQDLIALEIEMQQAALRTGASQVTSFSPAGGGFQQEGALTPPARRGGPIDSHNL
jgi:hypothetical protein